MIERTTAFRLAMLPLLLLGACSPDDSVRPATMTGSGGSAAGSGGSVTGSGGSLTGSGGSLTGSGGVTGTGGAADDGGTGSGGSSDASAPETANDAMPDGGGPPPSVGGLDPPGDTGRFAMARPPFPPEGNARMAGVVAGTTRTTMATSTTMGVASRQISVYTPAGYQMGTPIAFMVFHDGGAYSSGANFKIPVVFDNLAAQKKMPPAVGIFVPPVNRGAEYNTVSEIFTTYIVNDVLPAVERLGIKLTTDPDYAGAGGHSSGGICAFSQAWFRPDRFRRVLSNSGSFNLGGNMYSPMAGLIRSTMPKKPIRTAMTVGTNDLGGNLGSWYMASENQFMALTAMNYNVRYIVINGGSHDQSSPAPTTAGLVEWLWRGTDPAGPKR